MLRSNALSTVRQPVAVPEIGAVNGTTTAPVETRWMWAAVTFVRPLTVSVEQSLLCPSLMVIEPVPDPVAP